MSLNPTDNSVRTEMWESVNIKTQIHPIMGKQLQNGKKGAAGHSLPGATIIRHDANDNIEMVLLKI